MLGLPVLVRLQAVALPDEMVVRDLIRLPACCTKADGVFGWQVEDDCFEKFVRKGCERLARGVCLRCHSAD